MQKLTFETSSLNLKLFQWETDDPQLYMMNLARDLKKGSGMFVAESRTPGFVDLEYDKGCIKGGYAAVTVKAISNYDLEAQICKDVLINTLDTAEFLLLDKLIIASGDGNVIRILIHALSTMMGVTIFQKEFEDSEMENLLNVLSSVKQICGKNPKDSEIRGFNITGVIEDLNDFNFMANGRHDGKTIEAVKGAYNFAGGFAADVKITRKGNLIISGARPGMEIGLDAIQKFLAIVEQEEYQEDYEVYDPNEGQDDPEDAEVVSSIADLFN